MKILILSLIFCLLPSFVFAIGTMNVKTGIGYIKDNEDKVICKYNLPKGNHPLKDGYTYVEVDTIQNLGKIEIYQEPVKILTLDDKLKAIGLTKEDLKEIIK